MIPEIELRSLAKALLRSWCSFGVTLRSIVLQNMIQNRLDVVLYIMSFMLLMDSYYTPRSFHRPERT
jgi:hypothetical protein